MANVAKFRSQLGENIFRFKYSQGVNDTWDACADRIVDDVCGTRGNTAHPLLSTSDQKQLAQYIKEFKFLAS